jgi:hypothetical protein
MRDLVEKVKMDVIKGNAGEISALTGSDLVKMRGVDSLGEISADTAVAFVKEAALQQRCVIAMTGELIMFLMDIDPFLSKMVMNFLVKSLDQGVWLPQRSLRLLRFLPRIAFWPGLQG